MNFRIIKLPSLCDATSGLSKECDFSDGSILRKFSDYFSAIKLCHRDDFTPRDFLYFDEERGGMVWMWALSADIPDGGNEVIDFDSGYYLTYSYQDGDSEADRQTGDGNIYTDEVIKDISEETTSIYEVDPVKSGFEMDQRL